jgi:uncharacterized protein YfbU (UPF0304 family)
MVNGDEVPRTLSFLQRQLLERQHEILALLHGDDEWESQYHQTMAEVLREGYAVEYGRVFGGMEPEMSTSECALTRDILAMFRMVNASIEQLPERDRATLGHENESRLQFGGFDQNDRRESRMLGYVKHMIANDEWAEIKPKLAEIGDDGNSHSRQLPSYERMLYAYNSICDDTGRRHSAREWLTIDELRRIADAWPWPTD